MALQASKLANEIVKLGKSYPKDTNEAGKRWAHAYALYAADALSIPPTAAPPASLTAGERILAAALAKVWAGSVSAPTTAQGMAAALTAFWLTPPVVFGAGVVTSVTGTSALISALLSVWTSNQSGKQSADFCAKKVAAVVHTFTMTVITTTPFSPSPIVGPIS